MGEEYNQAGVDALANAGRPIPGQSLTNDPDQKYAWESPPEFTEFRPALNFIADKLLDKEVYVPLMKGIGDGIPLTDITLQMLQEGFQQGKWNPDLLMMLVEPTIYTLMALAEKANIKYRLNGDEEDDIDADDDDEISEMKRNNLKKLTSRKIKNQTQIPSGAIPSEILERVKDIEMSDSLLDKQESQPEESLLARGER